MKNFALTTQLLIELISEKSVEPSEKKALQLALARVYLQCGDIISAETYFSEVFKVRAPKTLNECVNLGLLHVARAEFQDALSLFGEGLKFEPKNIMVTHLF